MPYQKSPRLFGKVWRKGIQEITVALQGGVQIYGAHVINYRLYLSKMSKTSRRETACHGHSTMLIVFFRIVGP